MPSDEWVRQQRPELRIIAPALWDAVQARLRFVAVAFVHGANQRPRGRARGRYSPYLLAGLLRCGPCSARMMATTSTRRKGNSVHCYGWYRCSFAATKGPAVCSHGVGYRRDRIEAALLVKFRDAMTPARVDVLAARVNDRIEAAFRHRDARVEAVKREVLALEAQAGTSCGSCHRWRLANGPRGAPRAGGRASGVPRGAHGARANPEVRAAFRSLR